MRMQTDDMLILANNNFARKEEATIQTAKIMIKDRGYLTSSHLLKFNGAQIELNLKKIVLIKESHVNSIFFITNHNIDSTSLSRIMKKK